MLYNQYGVPIRSKQLSPDNGVRRGVSVDAMQLPDGAVVTLQKTYALHKKILDNALLRERIETADRMTGTRSIHLELIRRDEMTESVEKKIIKNQEFGEKVMSKRVSEEGLDRSKEGYSS